MKKLLFLLILIPFLGNSQATFTAPVGYNTGAPTATPSGVGTRWRFDLLTGKKYTWLPGTMSWDEDARGIDQVAGCSAPLYTPGYNQSTFAVNACSPPVLYQWTGAAWEIPNEPEIYTAGTGISIDGSNVITNTSPNIVQTLSIAGQDLSLSNGGGTVAIPGVSWPLLAPDGTVSSPSYSFANSDGSGVWYDGSTIFLQSASHGAALAKHIEIRSGDGIGKVAGDISIVSGTATGSESGQIKITSGNSTNNDSPPIIITGGNGTNSAGAAVQILSGNGATNGGAIEVYAGDGTSGDAGSIIIEAGAGATATQSRIVGAATTTGATGGLMLIKGGDSALGNGGEMIFRGGDGALGAGGKVTLLGGLGSTIANSGRVILSGSAVEVPRLLTVDRDALTGLNAGTVIYNTDATATDGSTGVMQVYNGTRWKNAW